MFGMTKWLAASNRGMFFKPGAQRRGVYGARGVVLSIATLAVTGCCGSNSSGTSTPPPPPLQTVATPTFSPASGTFTAGQSVSLADAMNGAPIYYTTDGTTPTTSSSTYTSAISFAIDMTMEAIGVASGYKSSTIAQGVIRAAGPAVSVVLSTHDGTQLMAAQGGNIFY